MSSDELREYQSFYLTFVENIDAHQKPFGFGGIPITCWLKWNICYLTGEARTHWKQFGRELGSSREIQKRIKCV